MTREEVESYLLRMGLDFEEVDEGLWVIQAADEDGVTVVANHSEPLLLLRLKVMDLPEGNTDGRFVGLYRRLLELNAGDILYGSYGIEEGLMYSFPVVCRDGNYSIVPDLPVSDFSRARMDATAAELKEEQAAVRKLLD